MALDLAHALVGIIVFCFAAARLCIWVDGCSGTPEPDIEWQQGPNAQAAASAREVEPLSRAERPPDYTTFATRRPENRERDAAETEEAARQALRTAHFARLRKEADEAVRRARQDEVDRAEVRRLVEAARLRQAAEDESRLRRVAADEARVQRENQLASEEALRNEESARLRREYEARVEHERREAATKAHRQQEAALRNRRERLAERKRQAIGAKAVEVEEAARAAADAVLRAKTTSELPPPSVATSTDSMEPGERWRRKADEQMKLREEASRLSQEAYDAKRGAEAKQLSEVRKRHDAQMRSYHAEAAAEIFAHHNPEYHVYAKLASDRNRCDLHGLYLKEAMQYATEHLDTCKKAGVDETIFITGVGNRSDTGPKLKPALEELLKTTDLIIKKGVPNKGCITVQFHSGAQR